MHEGQDPTDYNTEKRRLLSDLDKHEGQAPTDDDAPLLYVTSE
jgi:hypothetical protein